MADQPLRNHNPIDTICKFTSYTPPLTIVTRFFARALDFAMATRDTPIELVSADSHTAIGWVYAFAVRLVLRVCPCMIIA